uniref:Histone deacetylase 14 n=1 Tax=Tanacetum cinerariifolium TaxID=118510 RepID=A0A6L2K6Z8_TANCI|nr:hypothetical protein [Tanacetum cinerariifolium]
MPIHGSRITADIQEASYYREYLAKVAQHQRYLAGKTGSNPVSPTSKPTKPARKAKSTIPKAPQGLQSLLEQRQHNLHPLQHQPNRRKKSASRPQKHLTSLPKQRNPNMAGGPLPPVVIKEPELGKYQPLPEVPGKGKAKVTKDQVAHDLLSLQKPKKKSPVDQYIFQRRVSEPTRSSGHYKSPYTLLGQLDSEEESEKVVLGADEGDQDEGQAGPDPGQARPDSGDAGAKVQSIPSHVVHTGSDREHMDLDVAGVSPQPSTEQLDEGDRPSDAYKKAETEVESMVNVPIQQAMSSISLMTSPIIDLTLRPESPKEPAMMVKHIGELKYIMANLIQVNKDMEERLDKHGARLFTLEQLDIPQQVSIALFEALEKSMSRDHSKELVQDLAEARKKKKKSRESPKTSLGSPPHHLPPSPPPAGPSKASGAPGASGSSQVPLPPPPPPSSTNQDSSSKGSATPSSSKTTASAEYQAWTTIDVRLKPSISLTPADLEMDEDMGPAFKIIKVFHPDVIHLKYQMEECHKLLTDSVDDPILKNNLNKPLPLGGPPGQVTIQSDFFFNKDLEYLRYGSKGSRPALSISKMKAAYYPDARLKYAVRTHMRILSVVRIEVFSMYGYDYMKKIVLCHADLNEHVIVERDFKYLYPSDFEDMYLLNLQGHLNHLLPKDKKILTTAVNQWTRQLVIRQRVEDFQLGIESYQTQMNLTNLNGDTTGFEYKHDFTVIDSPRAVIFRDKYESSESTDESRFKYEVLDQEGRRSMQGVNVRYTEAFEDKENLPQPGEFCWWTRQRGRLQTFEAYRMIKSFRYPRPLSDDL